MGKAILRQKDLRKALRKAGFVEGKSTRGSHVKWVRGSDRVLVSGHGKDVPFYIVEQARAVGVNI